MKEKLLGIGSLISSILAAICCVGIALFAFFGLSALELTFASIITPYSNIFIVLTINYAGVSSLLYGKKYCKVQKYTNISMDCNSIICRFYHLFNFFWKSDTLTINKNIREEVFYAVYR